MPSYHAVTGRAEGGGGGGRPGRERAGAGRRGEAARRLRRALPHRRSAPRPDPTTPPSSALCAIAHLVLEARVGPRLEQRLDAGSVALVSRLVQRRPLVLPRRGGGPTHAGERWAGRRAGGGCLRRLRTPSPPPVPHHHSPARLPSGLHASQAAEGQQPATRRQRGAAAEGRSGASWAPPACGAAGQRRAASPAHSLTPHPSPPRRSRAAAHIVLGIHVGALGDEVLEAVELALLSHPHEGRAAILRRRGGGANSAVSGGSEGGAAGAAGGEGGGRGGRGLRAAGWAALAPSAAFTLAPLAVRCSRQSRLPRIVVYMRAVMPFCGGAAAAPHAVSGGEGGAAGAARAVRAEGEGPGGWGRLAGRRSPCLCPAPPHWPQGWRPWRRGARGSRACRWQLPS